MPGPWYVDFFGGSDYLTLFEPYLDLERTEAEVAALHRLLGLPDGARVLDLGCGQGRHAVPLSASYRVVGLDLSEHLLGVAQQRGTGPGWVRGDMRALPLASGSFDGVLNVFNSFGYLAAEAEDQRVLTEVARVLHHGGVLVQEYGNREALMRGWEPTSAHRQDSGLLVVEERRWDLARSRHHVTYTVVPPAGPPRRHQHTLRVYTLTELLTMHERAGLTPVSVRAGLAGEADSTDDDLGLDDELLTVVSRRA